MKVVINNRRVRLDEQAMLGAGGEALVLRHGSDAIKIYHDPTPARARKLADLLRLQPSLPPQVIFPVQPVFDGAGKEVIGFTMPALPQNLAVLASLGNKNFRATHDVTLCQVANLFLQMHLTVQAIHRAGLVIGDFNDQNVLFEGGQGMFIDVDSYQFGTHPCPVATEAFLDPQLYSLDLTTGPRFGPENDWYSFAVLLFRSLVLVHPYGGTHPKVKALTQRARLRMPVFHPEVVYPKPGLSLNFLSDDLAGVFHQIFAGGLRDTFPVQALADYAAQLRECQTCHSYFPATRRFCPACQNVLAFVMPRIKVAAGVQAEELVLAVGPIVACRAVAGKLYALAREENMAVLYLKEQHQLARRIALFKWLAGARYEFMDGYLVVNLPASNELLVLELTAEGAQPLFKTTTSRFNSQAVFATTERYLYRIAGGMLLRGEIKYGQLAERPLTAVLDGQTWFEASTTPTGQDIITGFGRIFRSWDWFRLEGFERMGLAVTEVAADEAVLDFAAKLHATGSLVLRHTRQAGLDYLRLDGFDSKGKLVFAQQRRLDEADESENLAGALYAGGVALWPTGEGIIKEGVAQRQRVELLATAPYVNGATHLTQYENGLLAVTDNRVWRLALV